ncbi:MAG: hypothetical protein HC890_05530 [Chloroflexaceae bacterium]|nr:hypothetical protein [Chloroflexaceae bacterium]
MSDKVPLNAAYDRILEEARLKIALARQHLQDLAEFGLSEDWLQALSAIADGAEEMPSPARQTGELKSLTAARDAALGACVQWVRKLRLRLQLAFDQQPPSGMQFPAQEWRPPKEMKARPSPSCPLSSKLLASTARNWPQWDRATPPSATEKPAWPDSKPPVKPTNSTDFPEGP